MHKLKWDAEYGILIVICKTSYNSNAYVTDAMFMLQYNAYDYWNSLSGLENYRTNDAMTYELKEFER